MLQCGMDDILRYVTAGVSRRTLSLVYLCFYCRAEMQQERERGEREGERESENTDARNSHVVLVKAQHAG